MCAYKVELKLASSSDLSSQMIRGLFDDFALVVSGNGGKDNVSAACIEVRFMCEHCKGGRRRWDCIFREGERLLAS
jgi:hypothetical protein